MKGARSRRRRLGRLLVIVAVMYVGWCAFLYFMQDRMMFPRDLARGATPEEIIPPFVEQTNLLTEAETRG